MTAAINRPILSHLAAAALALAACGCAEHPTIEGQWGWPGADCSSRRLEIKEGAISVIEGAQRFRVFEILEQRRTRNPAQIAISLRELEGAGSWIDGRALARRPDEQLSLSLRVDGDQLSARVLGLGERLRTIQAGEPLGRFFATTRCPRSV